MKRQRVIAFSKSNIFPSGCNRDQKRVILIVILRLSTAKHLIIAKGAVDSISSVKLVSHSADRKPLAFGEIMSIRLRNPIFCMKSS